MPTDRLQRLAEEICQTGRMLYDRGFIAATEGNLSCRVDATRVLCTPTMLSTGHLRPDQMCVVDLSGSRLGGYLRPSSEILLHLQVYRSNPAAGAVVHCHPPHATAVAVSRTPLPAGVLAEVEYFLQDIAVIPFRLPGTAELASLIAPHATTSRCAIMQNHGALSWGADLEQARWWMEILDAYCRTIILARQLGDVATIPAAEVARLRELGRVRLSAGDT